MLSFDAFSRNGVLGRDGACDPERTGCVMSIEKLWIIALGTCRQATTILRVILAQCPLSCQVQSNFLKVASDFSFHLIPF